MVLFSSHLVRAVARSTEMYEPEEDTPTRAVVPLAVIDALPTVTGRLNWIFTVPVPDTENELPAAGSTFTKSNSCFIEMRIFEAIGNFVYK